MNTTLRDRFAVVMRGCVFLSAVSGFAHAALPPLPIPVENPYNAAAPTADQEAKRVLGKILFWEEQMSADNTVACGTCHVLDRSGTDDRRSRHPGLDGVMFTNDDTFGSPGVVRQGDTGVYKPDVVFEFSTQVTRRTAPPVINAAYAPHLFHDGRAGSVFYDPQNPNVVRIASGGALENQAVGPPMNDGEMGHELRDWNELAAKLAGATPLILAANIPPDVAAVLANPATDSYPELFAAAFPSGLYPDNPNPAQITGWKIAFAIATYERTLISDDSPWDRRMADPDNFPLPAVQEEGWQLFNALCVECHHADNGTDTGPVLTKNLFTDHLFHYIGLRPTAEDYGRAEVTCSGCTPAQMAVHADRGKFKSVTLRNIGLKTNYMHHGGFSGLLATIQFYKNGNPGCAECMADRDPRLAAIEDFMNNYPEIIPPDADQKIEAFLKHALTDPRVKYSQFPFDFPTVWSRRPADKPAVLPGGLPGSGTYFPYIVANTPPMLGNTEFKIGVGRARGGATARLGVASTPPVNGRITPEGYLGTITLYGTPGVPGTGFGTLFWPVPNNGALAGKTRYLQWFIDDPEGYLGQSASQPIVLTFFCPRPGCPPTCSADIDDGSGVGIPDGGVDINDLLYYLAKFEVGSTEADLDDDGSDPANPDSGVDINDLLFFLNHFEIGC